MVFCLGGRVKAVYLHHWLLIRSPSSLTPVLTFPVCFSVCVCISVRVLVLFFSLPCGCYDYKIVVGTTKGILENVKGSVHLNKKKKSILSHSSTAFQICRSFDFLLVLARRYFSVAVSR